VPITAPKCFSSNLAVDNVTIITDKIAETEGRDDLVEKDKKGRHEYKKTTITCE
jgi:hypothetical protein